MIELLFTWTPTSTSVAFNLYGNGIIVEENINDLKIKIDVPSIRTVYSLTALSASGAESEHSEIQTYDPVAPDAPQNFHMQVLT